MARFLDPSTASGTIILQIVCAVFLAIGVMIAGWLFGPVRWWRDGRRIRQILLLGRHLLFVYRPTENMSKNVTFLPNGQIGEGRNTNEHTWRLRRGRLELLAADGKVYSRFRFDADAGRLVHTNDPDCRSVFGQYFEPQYKAWPKPNQPA
jgi:hypothetical protein